MAEECALWSNDDEFPDPARPQEKSKTAKTSSGKKRSTNAQNPDSSKTVAAIFDDSEVGSTIVDENVAPNSSANLTVLEKSVIQMERSINPHNERFTFYHLALKLTLF